VYKKPAVLEIGQINSSRKRFEVLFIKEVQAFIAANPNIGTWGNTTLICDIHTR
jgi:hypothetical protein